MSTWKFLLDTSDPDYSHDYALALPSKPDGAWCSGCLQLKSLRHFKRLASLSQTRAWLHNPLAQRRLQYEGKECNSCHDAKTKRPEDLTREQMRRRLRAEGVHDFVIKDKIAKRKQQATVTHKEVIRKTRQKLFAEDYARVQRELMKLSKRVDRAHGMTELAITNLREDIRKARYIISVLKQKGKKPPEDWRQMLAPDYEV